MHVQFPAVSVQLARGGQVSRSAQAEISHPPSHLQVYIYLHVYFAT